MNYIKNVPNVSANSILSLALEKMRQARAQMAFVVENNNSDKVIGIITIEDIIEEVVGEIYDEYDTDEMIYEISLEKSRARGNVLMKTLWKQLEFEEEFDLTLPEDEEKMTLSEWIEKQLHHSLRVNSKLEYQDKITFKVLSKKNTKKKYDVIEIDWGN